MRLLNYFEFTFLLLLMVSACQNPEAKTVVHQKNHQNEKVAVSGEIEGKAAADPENSDFRFLVCGVLIYYFV